MNVFDIPVSAIRAAQAGMNTVSSNLANASTPGYHLQRAQLSETQPTLSSNLRVGAGVDVSSIQRMRSAWIEQSLLRNTSQAGESQATLDAANQLDSLFTPTDNSLHAQTQQFFEAWQDLSTRPADSTLRRNAISAASSLANEINNLNNTLTSLSRDFDTQIADTVNQINSLSTNISTLNKKIEIAEASGTAAHDLTDQRDQLVSQLSGLIDVESLEGLGQPNTFAAANGAMVIGSHAPQMALDESSGKIQVVIDGWTSPLPAGGGKLAGLIEARDGLIAGAKSDLENWSAQLVRSVDQIHAQGLGLDGPLTTASGSRSVADSSIPLANALKGFPIDAGKLAITMTDATTGQRTVHLVQIEPGLDSLDDIAARISTIPHLSAQVSDESGRLTLIADQGYGFEFTGRTATEPDMSPTWSGSATIGVDGTYSGSANSDWTISMIGGGTIGVTPDLRAQISDSAGNVVGVFNVGLGYAAGDPLTTSQGVTLRFNQGTVVDGQTASLHVTANPDESGILSALGVNSIFTGDRAGAYGVQQDLLDDPGRLAVGRSDQPGDNSNSNAFAALGDQRLGAMGGQTFGEYLSQMTADAGTAVQSAQASTDQLGQINSDLEAQRQSVSGVDPNEELVKLLEYQRLFQSAARFISTVNEAIDDLFNMAR